ncbi:hypothetical protein OBK15_06360 [Empedobacter falsenii]
MSQELISKFSNFELQLSELKFACDDPIEESKKAIALITDFLDQIQMILTTHQFNSLQDELDYFKKD